MRTLKIAGLSLVTIGTLLAGAAPAARPMPAAVPAPARAGQHEDEVERQGGQRQNVAPEQHHAHAFHAQPMPRAEPVEDGRAAHRGKPSTACLDCGHCSRSAKTPQDGGQRLMQRDERDARCEPASETHGRMARLRLNS